MTNTSTISWYQYPAKWARGLYHWVLHWADTRFSIPALFAVAFIESSFFPIPPDVLLMGMSLGKPKRAFYFALVCSVGSVLGGMFGFLIGYYLWSAVHSFFIPNIFSQDMFNLVQHKYETHSFWVIFIAAFTPIPYKIFTIAAGVCNIPLGGFVLASIIGRSMRFFMVAALLYFWGERTKNFISKYFEWLTLAFTVLLVGGFLLAKKFL